MLLKFSQFALFFGVLLLSGSTHASDLAKIKLHLEGGKVGRPPDLRAGVCAPPAPDSPGGTAKKRKTNENGAVPLMQNGEPNTDEPNTIDPRIQFAASQTQPSERSEVETQLWALLLQQPSELG